MFGAAATLLGADFWQKKKFTEWTEKEVRRMLNDSPWVHTYDVMAGGGVPSGGGGGGGRRRGGGGGGGGFSADTGSVGGEGGGGEGGYGGGAQPQRPIAVVRFRVLSALPVKQAIVKMRYGDEALTSPDAAKTLSRKETAYVIGIAGLPPSLLGGADADSLKNATQLRIKGRPAAYAREIHIEKEGPMLNIYALFSRADNPMVVEDGEFQVVLKLPSGEMKRTFKLKDMVYEGKLEI